MFLLCDAMYFGRYLLMSFCNRDDSGSKFPTIVDTSLQNHTTSRGRRS